MQFLDLTINLKKGKNKGFDNYKKKYYQNLEERKKKREKTYKLTTILGHWPASRQA